MKTLHASFLYAYIKYKNPHVLSRTLKLRIGNYRIKPVFYFQDAKVVMTVSPCDPSSYDENNNGSVEKKEIEHIFTDKEEEADTFFGQADLDGSEFKSYTLFRS